VTILGDDSKRARNGRRAINGVVGLRVPADVIDEKCRPYMRNGKPIHRLELTNNSVFDIVVQYQQVYRGIANYYQMAYNLHRLSRLKWVMETSLVKTLAHKLKVSVPKVYARFGTIHKTEHGTYQVLRYTVSRGPERKPLVAQWGGIPLRWRIDTALNDQLPPTWVPFTELEQRLLADQCELCGSRWNVQVHHVRALKDLRRQGRIPRPLWVMAMAARRRKTLVVCRRCHMDIHHGRSKRHETRQ
jgi:hypothetical protein